MDNSAIIKCENIAKRYGGKDILKNVSLACKRGEAIALVGANGCGKSTLLRILAGVTRPSSGEVIYAHSNIKMSFIPDHFEKLDIPAGKLLKYMLEGFDLKDADTKMKRLCEQFRIDKLLDVPLKHLSKGSLQKIATIQALICENDLVLMDEPLSGQDMMSKLCFIQEVLDRKKAVLYCTADVRELRMLQPEEGLCF